VDLTPVAPDLAAVMAECERRVFAAPRPRETRHPRAADLRAVRSQLPARMLPPATLGDLAHWSSGNAAIRAARLAWRPDRSLLLLGPTGVGKTSAAAWCFRAVLQRGAESPHEPEDDRTALDRALGMVWAHVPTLERARREWPLGRGECPELRQAERASVLVLDEFGWHRDADWLAVLLNARYERRAPVIVTSASSLAQLERDLPGSLLRRIRESGSAPCVIGDAHAEPTGAP
jgi:DNA replication protein DnaC